MRKLEGGGLSILKHSSVNGLINQCFSSCVVINYDYITTITFDLNVEFIL